ncbi:hypothetical protein D9758_007979 [Tetrapyrgos nigripes]|uniref:Wings apart-like protein C-terminal domain-containing protein n=1 Tax=Tetrapyrgos nigripes TaxID=182062 RepID=A0A8H5D0F5_9AGAR|nr:hypothetical protein D9758_007979 [Tetrapyrgos nigripes]
MVASEIVSRLCDVDFSRKAKAADFLTQTWETFMEAGAGKNQDKVLDVLLAFFCALVARDLVSLTDLAERTTSPSSSVSQSSFVATLFSLLSSLTLSTDPLYLSSNFPTADAQLKKLGIMKSDRAMISTILLITQTLATLPANFLTPNHVPSLLKSFRNLITMLPGLPMANGDTKSTAPLKQQNSVTDTDDIPFAALQHLLNMLDSCLLSQWDSSSSASTSDNQMENELEQTGDEWLADGLLSIGLHSEAACRAGNSDYDIDADRDTDTAEKCIECTFRVLVSLTHANPRWSETLARNPAAVLFIIRTVVRSDSLRNSTLKGLEQMGVDKKEKKAKVEESSVKKIEPSPLFGEDDENGDEDKDEGGEDASPNSKLSKEQALDRLCLALGLLTNLVQAVDDAKRILREIMQVYTHQLSSPSLPNATTSKKQHNDSGIKIKQERSPSPTTTNVSLSRPLPSIAPNAAVDSDSSFLLGHLSVLFGLLMFESPENQELILDALPASSTSAGIKRDEDEDAKPSKSGLNSSSKSKSVSNGRSRMTSRRAKLDDLIDNAKTLARYLAAINQRSLRFGLDHGDGGGDEGGGSSGQDADRNQDQDQAEGSSDSRNGKGNERLDVQREMIKGAEVAQEIIAFLEELRDDCDAGVGNRKAMSIV